MSTVNYNDTVPAAPANYNNIKWQSDASGNISAYDPGGTWQTWTPTIGASGAMTVSGITITQAIYLRMGSLLFLQLQVQFTLGGTADTNVTVTTPAVSGASSAQYLGADIIRSGDGFWNFATAILPASSSTMTVRQTNANILPLGATQIAVFGMYRC